jgi:dTDP-4-amino-4,6-dideoxygalactose transaminase
LYQIFMQHRRGRTELSFLESLYNYLKIAKTFFVLACPGADYDRIFAVCDRFHVPVVVDAAEAMGARYGRKGGVHAGKGAKAAVFSFNGNKIMTSSGGGMPASDDKALIDRARFLSQQARDPVPHYEHTEIGFNYRMSNVLAGIGRGQLAVLDERVQRRRQIFAYYRHALEGVPGIDFMPEAAYGRANRWLSVILILKGVSPW